MAKITLPSTGGGGGGGADLSAVEGRLNVIEANTPTLEEQTVSLVLDSGSITTAATLPFATALFPSRVMQVALTFAAAVVASDTNYWTVAVVRYRNGAPTVLASHSTRLAGLGVGIAAFKPWTFDLVAFSSRDLVTGDVLVLTFTPTGAPAPLVSPALSVRLPASDVPAPPAALIIDDFNRADAATLGVSTSLVNWEVSTGWTIVGNVAHSTTSANLAIIESGQSNVLIEAKIAALPSGSTGIVFRYTDAENYYSLIANNITRKVAGVNTNLGAWGSANLTAAGDTIRVRASGSTLQVYVDKGSTGAFVLASEKVNETHNLTATRHGLRSSGSGTKIDNFRIDSL